MVSDLEAQITAIRTTAAQRTTMQRARQDLVDTAVLNEKPADGVGADGDRNRGAGGGRGGRATGQRPPSKRDIDQQMEGEGDDVSDDDGRMDIDEGIGDLGHVSGLGHGRGGGHSSRGAKRNRGRGSAAGSK